MHSDDRAQPTEEAAVAFDEALSELHGLLERRAVMQAAAALVAERAGLDVVWIAEPIHNDRLEIRHLHRTHTEILRGLIVPRGWGLGGKVFDTGHLEAVDQYFASRRITHHFDREVAAEGIQRMIAAPIVSGDRTLGVIWGACRHPGSFGSVAESALRQTTRRTATALEAADRAQHLAETAVHDHRRDLAVRLHDSLGATLFAIQASVQELSEALTGNPELRARAETIGHHAGTAAAALRESLEALSAPPTNMSLEVALRADCRAFEDRTGLPASFVVLASELPDLGTARVEALVAAVREALLNVEKHARASAVLVTLSSADGQLQVSVTDDGVGVTKDSVAEARQGLGLAATRERLERLGGGLTLKSADEGGAILCAWLPQ